MSIHRLCSILINAFIGQRVYQRHPKWKLFGYIDKGGAVIAKTRTPSLPSVINNVIPTLVTNYTDLLTQMGGIFILELTV